MEKTRVDRWTELREVLAEAPSNLGFRLVCALIDTWPGSEVQAAFDLAEKALAEWPDEVCASTWTWCCAAMNRATSPSWLLVRSLVVADVHIGCCEIDLAAAERISTKLTAIDLGDIFYEDSSPISLLARSIWPELRRLALSRFCRESGAMRELLAAPWVPQLQILRLSLAGCKIEQHLPHLSRLEIAGPIDAHLVECLAGLDAPRLTALSLDNNFHDGLSHEALHDLAQLPILSQIRELDLRGEWNEKTLRSLAEPGLLQLDSFKLRGNGLRNNYRSSDGDIESTVRLLEHCGTLKNLQTLSIQLLKIGDEVVDLVAQSVPGRLRSIELLDVELTDAGIRRLAHMPHLAGLDTLSLVANPISSEGIKALARSPHVGKLRRLSLGGNEYNPYYGDCKSQNVGAGVAALLDAPFIEHLESLTLINGTIDLAILSSPRLRNLRFLDLSFNSLSEAHEILLFLPSLRTLRLQCCGLQDGFIAQLLHGELPVLQELDLSYNSISSAGARTLAAWPGLGRLRLLILHDNILESAGLIALAESAYAGQLLELDVEQDCWNSRFSYFSDEAAQAVAHSHLFARLDAFWGGMVDEYHWARYCHPFRPEGQNAIHSSRILRPPVRWGLSWRESDAQVETKLLASPEERAKYKNVLGENADQEAARIHKHDFRNRK